jgi:UDP-N-acetylmuramoylalanine--D-glutamate ligase
VKKALIIGLGVSGTSASGYLLRKGVDVTGVDGNEKLLTLNPHLQCLREQGLVVAHDASSLNVEDFDAVIVSPGVPRSHPLYQSALQKGVEVVGEAELAFRNLHQPCAAITGTNGKTTVTLLVAHILNQAGKKARALGNVGNPLIAYAEHPQAEEIIVAELSSYQLETMHARVFDAGIILNVTPDHLDRYRSMDEYAAAKCQLQNCMKENGSFYVHFQAAADYKSLLKGRPYKTFGHAAGSDLWTDKEKIKEAENIEYILPLGYRELGMHESENALAAWALVRQFGVSGAQFYKGLETFKKPAHRIEFVKRIDGVSYYDDSKGTNIDATVQAVGSMGGPVVLIAGGVDKGASYTSWKGFFRNKVKRIIVLGQAAGKIQSELSDEFEVEIVNSLSMAVESAAAYAECGDCVLLSPGCSSFDMFRDYAHRGEEFKRHVDHLEERRKK